MLDALDLESGEQTFADFCKDKNPNSTSDRYLVVATWLKHNAKIDVISVDHINTCFRLMDWQMPDTPGQTFRNLKARNQYFKNGPEQGTWEITILGLNAVSKMSRTP